MKSRLEVKVVPGASRTEIVGWLGDAIKIKVAAAPEKGKANQAVIKLLSETLAVEEKAITILSGLSSQRKIIEIDGVDAQRLGRSLPVKSTSREAD